MFIAYCDDLTIVGKKGSIEESAHITWPIIAAYGFRINKSKCEFISPMDDAVIPGMPMGSQKFIDKYIDDIVEEFRIKTSRINTKNIASKTRLLFPKECINTIPTM